MGNGGERMKEGEWGKGGGGGGHSGIFDSVLELESDTGNTYTRKTGMPQIRYWNALSGDSGIFT